MPQMRDFKNLFDVCFTRWIERERMGWAADCANLSLSPCEPRFNNYLSVKADSLLKFVTDYISFITTLFITRNILTYLLPVTRKLQTKNSDIAQSIDLIKSLKPTIEMLRNNFDFYHTESYGIAGGFCI